MRHAHPDVTAMYQALRSGAGGGVGTLSVTLEQGVRPGKTMICPFCRTGTKGVGVALGLDELHVGQLCLGELQRKALALPHFLRQGSAIRPD
jgi:hypothetical protein